MCKKLWAVSKKIERQRQFVECDASIVAFSAALYRDHKFKSFSLLVSVTVKKMKLKKSKNKGKKKLEPRLAISKLRKSF